jgi:uncharacterized glyoxalase superfamily protein PhnB
MFMVCKRENGQLVQRAGRDDQTNRARDQAGVESQVCPAVEPKERAAIMEFVRKRAADYSCPKRSRVQRLGSKAGFKGMTFHPPIPVLRIFDAAKAREHYVGFLGFKIDWEHRFGDNFPLYLQISRDACVMHLSEHHGDACPGTAIRIQVTGLEDFCRDLVAQDYKFAKPGLMKVPWGQREMTIADPFGNKIIFFEPLPAE